MKVKYPDITVTVKLVGEDGNPFSIMGRVKRALEHGGVSKEECNLFIKEAMSGDYDNLLTTCMNWVNIE